MCCIAAAQLAKPLQKCLAAASTPQQDGEGVVVEALREEVERGREVLARDLPVRAGTAQSQVLGPLREQRRASCQKNLLEVVGHLPCEQPGTVDRLLRKGYLNLGPHQLAEGGQCDGHLVGSLPGALHRRRDHARGHLQGPVSYTHLRAHETGRNLVCRLLLEKKKIKNNHKT